MPNAPVNAVTIQAPTKSLPIPLFLKRSMMPRTLLPFVPNTFGLFGCPVTGTPLGLFGCPVTGTPLGFFGCPVTGTPFGFFGCPVTGTPLGLFLSVLS